jgi:hypothetical protein
VNGTTEATKGGTFRQTGLFNLKMKTLAISMLLAFVAAAAVNAAQAPLTVITGPGSKLKVTNGRAYSVVS